MGADKTADIKFSNISFTTDSAKVNEFVTTQENTQPLAENKTFAKSVRINNKKVYSSVDRWDLSQISDNILKG